MRDIAGRRIWLTGASYGIGRELAIELARRGCALALTARSEDKLQSLRAELADLGAKAIVVPGDVTNSDRMKEAAEEIRSELGGIDVLIANAGTHIFTVPERFDADEYLSLMDLNYGGLVRCIEAVLPEMLKRGSGHIVGVVSLAGYRALPRAAAYGASKAAAHHFLDSIRFHLAEHNIPVTVVNPGFVRTPLTDKNDFHMPFLIDADRAARIICNGIARQKDEISFPIPFNWIIKFVRIIPFPIYKWIMTRVWKRTMKN